MRWTIAALLALYLAVPGAAARADQQVWRTTASDVSYKLVHKFHTVTGTSHSVEGAAAIGDDSARVQIRIPVKSFESGNANRDAHMLEVVDGAAYPFVSLRGQVPANTLPAVGSRGKVKLNAELDFHGVKERRQIEIEIARPNPKQLFARFQFPVSLTKHKVERPSLLFVKVNDEITITGSFKLEPK